MNKECEHNRPFWECDICGNEKASEWICKCGDLIYGRFYIVEGKRICGKCYKE